MSRSAVGLHSVYGYVCIELLNPLRQPCGIGERVINARCTQSLQQVIVSRWSYLFLGIYAVQLYR